MADFDLSNLSPDVKAIPLTQGYHALVDAADYELVATYKWHVDIHNNRKREIIYARAIINNKKVRIHRLITGAHKNSVVDHINGNGLDNRRCNLRICDNIGNAWNSGKKSKNPTSKFKGVSWRTRSQKWIMQIRIGKNQKLHGYFNTEVDAARAYNEAAIKYHGEFARLNQLP